MYFRLEGQLGGKPVSGMGRLPLVYNASQAHSPWLQVDVDGRLIAADDGRLAWILNARGRVSQVHAGGALFTGLSRPWVGFHTLDTIRRDAAAERIPFQVEFLDQNKTASVTLVSRQTSPAPRLRYTVDMEQDTLKAITLWADSTSALEQPSGELRFSYLNEIGNLPAEPLPPVRVGVRPSDRKAPPTILWPIALLGASG